MLFGRCKFQTRKLARPQTSDMEMELVKDFTQQAVTRMNALDYCRWLQCLYQENGSPGGASELFALRYPRNASEHLIKNAAVEFLTKAAVNPGTTVEPTFAAPISPLRPLESAIVELARSASLLGKIKRFVPVPFNAAVPVQTLGGTYRWVGQGGPISVGRLSLSSTSLPILTAGGIIVVTQELLRATSEASVKFLRNDLVRGIAQYLDQQLTDPTVAAVANVSPASITNAAPSVGSAGSSAANALTDIKNLLATYTATNPNTETMVMLASPAVAIALAVAANTQTLGPDGGTLFGVPVATSQAVGARVIVMDPTALWVADDDGLEVTISAQASLEMDTSASSPPVAGTVLVSLWQHRLVGLKVRRFINWKMARANSVLYTNVAYV